MAKWLWLGFYKRFCYNNTLWQGDLLLKKRILLVIMMV